jgi:hypothetical protein
MDSRKLLNTSKLLFLFGKENGLNIGIKIKVYDVCVCVCVCVRACVCVYASSNDSVWYN